MAITRSIISPDESELIRYLLTVRRQPSDIKSGLQQLCAFYEAGKNLANKDQHYTLVKGLIIDKSVIIRRWAYKAIAWLGEPSDADILMERLAHEQDPENQTWIMAAIISLGRDRDPHELSSKTGVGEKTSLLLATRLFKNEKWLRENPDLPTIDIENPDPLILKWAALLAGYDRAPTNLFHPRIENRELLARLNLHPHAEVSEYSVWALWQNPGFALSDMAIKLQDIQEHPQNVRRWINRLATKSESFLARNIELLDELKKGAEYPAREGLALGMRSIFSPSFSPHILQWHNEECEESIRELLCDAFRHK